MSQPGHLGVSRGTLPDQFDWLVVQGRALDLDLARNRAQSRARVIARAIGFPRRLPIASFLARRCETVEAQVLGCLAHFLPADEHARFVVEAQGNLGACPRWWQRVDHLVGLALGTPRLAWMMRREGRRGRV